MIRGCFFKRGVDNIDNIKNVLLLSSGAYERKRDIIPTVATMLVTFEYRQLPARARALMEPARVNIPSLSSFGCASMNAEFSSFVIDMQKQISVAFIMCREPGFSWIDAFGMFCLMPTSATPYLWQEQQNLWNIFIHQNGSKQKENTNKQTV